jgi:hypothetical protein
MDRGIVFLKVSEEKEENLLSIEKCRGRSSLKRLGHKIEITFGNMNTSIYSIGLNKGRGRF